MIKYIRIVLFGYLAVISINVAQEYQIDIRSVNISGNESIKKKELMPLLRQRPSNFSFTFKGTSFNNRLLKMDGLTLKNYFISKGFLMVEVNESAIIDGNRADIYFEINEGKQFFVSNVVIEGNVNLSKEKILPLFYLILECDDISALGEYEDNSDFTNNTGDAPDDIGFREITDDTKSEIEWSSEVIKYDTL